jgi:hypothetical protein
MTKDELQSRFPNASPDFLARNACDQGQGQSRYYNSRVHSVQPESDERLSLDAGAQGEETRWYASARRFEIVFTVYSQRPCDWDGWDIKALQDFLCKAGILPDDGWKTLSGRVVSEKVATEGEEKTVITITAC